MNGPVFLCVTGGKLFVVAGDGKPYLIGLDASHYLSWARKLYRPYAIVRPREKRG